jgi:enhancing lycopene biosynthesis protein 2
MTKVAVILSGCGVYDGSEVHEAVLTLLAIEQQGASYQCFAPNIPQHHVINHVTCEVMADEQRNVLIESARLNRGEVDDLSELRGQDFQAIIFVGGFGVAKNLSSFALDRESYTANSQVIDVAKCFAKANKAAGFMCIAPALLPFIYPKGIKGTIGNDTATADLIAAQGLSHQEASVADVVIDEQHKVVTTPAYMSAQSISEAALVINKLVKYVLAFC